MSYVCNMVRGFLSHNRFERFALSRHRCGVLFGHCIIRSLFTIYAQRYSRRDSSRRVVNDCAGGRGYVHTAWRCLSTEAVMLVGKTPMFFMHLWMSITGTQPMLGAELLHSVH